MSEPQVAIIRRNFGANYSSSDTYKRHHNDCQLLLMMNIFIIFPLISSETFMFHISGKSETS